MVASLKSGLKGLSIANGGSEGNELLTYCSFDNFCQVGEV